MKPHFLPELDTKVRESTFNILQHSFLIFLGRTHLFPWWCILESTSVIPYNFQSPDLLVSFRCTVEQSIVQQKFWSSTNLSSNQSTALQSRLQSCTIIVWTSSRMSEFPLHCCTILWRKETRSPRLRLWWQGRKWRVAGWPFAHPDFGGIEGNVKQWRRAALILAHAGHPVLGS